jgi:hypothetical protein
MLIWFRAGGMSRRTTSWNATCSALAASSTTVGSDVVAAVGHGCCVHGKTLSIAVVAQISVLLAWTTRGGGSNAMISTMASGRMGRRADCNNGRGAAKEHELMCGNGATPGAYFMLACGKW